MVPLQIWVAVGVVTAALQLFAIVRGAASAEPCAPLTHPALYVTKALRNALVRILGIIEIDIFLSNL